MAVTEAITENRQYRNLYGGMFDPAQGDRTASIDISQLLLSLLFFDKIVVPDNFFFVYGPLFRHFQRLQSSSNRANDVILQLLKNKFIVPNLRKCETLIDLWTEGENIGVRPGEFLNVTKEEGEKLVQIIQPYVSGYEVWPKEMAEATTNLFGEMIYDYLSSDKSPLRIKVPEHGPKLQYAMRMAPLSGQAIIAIRRTIEDFHQLVADRMSDPKFRRGEIETFIAEQAGAKNFSYDSFNISSARDPIDCILSFIIHQVSTVYELYQASSFNLSAQLYSFHDPFLPIAALTPGFLELAEDPHVCFVDMCAEIDPTKLNAVKLIGLRAALIDEGENLFEKQVEKRTKMMASNSIDDILNFVDFCKTRYIPAILQLEPQLKRRPIASNFRRARAITGNIGGGIAIFGVLVGGLSVTVIPIVMSAISAISSATSIIGISFPDSSMTRIAPIDRISNMRREQRAWGAFIKRQNHFAPPSAAT